MKKLISGIILLLASFLVFAENTAIELAVEAMEKQDYETAKKLFEPEASKVMNTHLLIWETFITTVTV